MNVHLLPELIRETETAPATLAKLRSEFLSIEPAYNKVVADLKNERAALVSKFENLQSSLAAKLQAAVSQKENDFRLAHYLIPVVQSICRHWNSRAGMFAFTRILCIIAGLALIITSWLYPNFWAGSPYGNFSLGIQESIERYQARLWYVRIAGVILLGLSYLVFLSLANSLRRRAENSHGLHKG